MPERPTVLVVEDVALVRLLVADYLRAGGFEVIEAANSDVAMQILDAGDPVDIVFSDIVMPGESDGLALARWVRTHHPEVRVVLGSGVAGMAERAAASGIKAPVVPKPYRQHDLEHRLRTALATC